MKLAITTASLEGYGLHRIFRFAKEALFDGVELDISKKNFDTCNAEYLNELIKEYDLPIIAIKTAEPKEKTILDAVALALNLGTKIIIVDPPKIFDLKYAQWLKQEVPKIREKEEISIALENAANETIFGFIPATSMNSLRDLKDFKHVCINTAFAANKKENIIDLIMKMKNYLVHVHLTNIKQNKIGALPQSGILPVESFLSKLKQEEYKGCVSLDVNPKNLRVGKDDELKKLLTEAREFCLKYI